MSASEVDYAFSILPASTRTRIDRAFDSAITSTQSTPPRKRRKLNHESLSPMPGGFIPDSTSHTGGFVVDSPAPAPGGFIIDEPAVGGFILDSEESLAGGFIPDGRDDSIPQEESKIPLSLIPTALQLLDLPPDDEDVLAVFRNAASGWSESHQGTSTTLEDEERFVSRKDWRAVCTALLDTGEHDQSDGDGSVQPAERESDEEGVPSEEDYNPSDITSSSAEENESDEYVEGGFIRSKRKGQQTQSTKARMRTKSGTTSVLDSDGDDVRPPEGITERQKVECRRTFSLFFPDMNDQDLDKKRLMIRDVSRVASLLKEKLTAEDIIEMLETFSASADKSMSLADFERMMIAAKLA